MAGKTEIRAYRLVERRLTTNAKEHGFIGAGLKKGIVDPVALCPSGCVECIKVVQALFLVVVAKHVLAERCCLLHLSALAGSKRRAMFSTVVTE